MPRLEDQLRVKKISEHATLPARGSDGAAGYDFYAVQDVIVPPYWWQLLRGRVKPTIVNTGVRWSVENVAGSDESCVLLLRDRSSVAMSGLRVEAGVIDADYRGEIKFAFTNFGPGWRRLLVGERVGQGLVLPTPSAALYQFHATDAPPGATARGGGGFGSTGK